MGLGTRYASFSPANEITSRRLTKFYKTMSTQLSKAERRKARLKRHAERLASGTVYQAPASTTATPHESPPATTAAKTTVPVIEEKTTTPEPEVPPPLAAEAPPPPPPPKKRTRRRKATTTPRGSAVAAAKSVKKARKSGADNNDDSGTVSLDEFAEARGRVYTKSLKQRTEDSKATREARKKGMMDSAAAVYSEVLDSELNVPRDTQSIHFSLGQSGGKDAPEVDADHRQRQPSSGNKQAREPLAQLATNAKNAIDVKQGEADRAIFQDAIEHFEQAQKRPATHVDIPKIRRNVATAKKKSDAAARSSKWVKVLDDKDLVKVAGDEVSREAALLRARIESGDDNPEARERREAVLHLSETAEQQVQAASNSMSELSNMLDHECRVDVSEVTATGHVTSVRATTPAPGTEYRAKVEQEIKDLEDSGVIISEAAKEYKLANSVPSGLPVPGRELVNTTSSSSLGSALIRGNGSTTVHDPTDYALMPLKKMSNSSMAVVELFCDEVRQKVCESIQLYYSMYPVMAEDTDMVQNDTHHAELFLKGLHEEIKRHFPRNDKEAASCRQYAADLLAGYGNSERNQQLAKRMKDADYAEKQSAQREALIDALVADGTRVANVEDDVLTAAQRKATRWQEEAELEALRNELPDLTDEELAEVQAHDLDPQHSILLRKMRDYKPNDMLYTNTEGDAPITLHRGTKNIFNDNENSVVKEARRMVEVLYNGNDYEHVLRTEKTRELRAAQARVDELRQLGGESQMTKKQIQELSELLKLLQIASQAADTAFSRELERRYKHPHARVAVEGAINKTAASLETVSRSYARQFMREPLGEQYGERECTNGIRCVCNVLHGSLRYSYDGDRSKGGFVCREFLLPSEMQQYRRLGSSALPCPPRPCYLCYLYQTTYLFNSNSMQKKESLGAVLQNFRTIFGVPGEYGTDRINLACVINHRSYGIVAPFPAFDCRYYQYGLCHVTVDDDLVVENMVNFDSAKKGTSAVSSMPPPSAAAAAKKKNMHRELRCIVEEPGALFH